MKDSFNPRCVAPRPDPDMPSDITHGAARLTSSLNDAHNDTGRIAFCGPVVLSAITGYSVSKVEDEIRAFRNLAPGAKPIVKGTLLRGGGRRACPLRLHHGAQAELPAPRPQGAPVALVMDAEAAQRLGALHPRHPQGQGGPLGADQGRQAVRHLQRGQVAVRVRRPAQGRPHHGSVRGEEGR